MRKGDIELTRDRPLSYRCHSPKSMRFCDRKERQTKSTRPIDSTTPQRPRSVQGSQLSTSSHHLSLHILDIWFRKLRFKVQSLNDSSYTHNIPLCSSLYRQTLLVSFIIKNIIQCLGIVDSKQQTNKQQQQ